MTGTRELEPEIVRISKQFGVLSRFTAYVAIDQGAVVNQGGKPQRVVQPVESPAGWGTLMNSALESTQLCSDSPSPGTFGSHVTFSAEPTLYADAGEPFKGDTFSYGGQLKGGGAAFPASSSKRLISSTLRASAPSSGAPKFSASVPPPGGSISRTSRVSTSAGITSPAGSPGAPFTTTSTAHTRRLTALATELTALATGNCDPTPLRRLRQRLTQWIEDVRSVGGEQRFTAAVEALVRRLTTALVAPKNPTEIQTIASELVQLVTGTTSVSSPSTDGAPLVTSYLQRRDSS